MLTIGIIANEEKDNDFKYTKILAEKITARGAKAILASDAGLQARYSCEGMDEDSVISGSDIVVCLGGDGTFLKCARKAYKYARPLLGINLGTLGFLTEVEKNDIENAVGCLIEGRFTIEHRMMLEMRIIQGENIIESDVALNDVVISRKSLSRILHLKMYINNNFIDTFPGDGLIISSPTGSTAYSLSAGGPIVEPDTELIIITPICPHILYSRSFITSGNRTVKVVVDEENQYDAMVTVDGQKGYEIKNGHIIEVVKSDMYIKIIRLNPHNFFNVLRKKIYNREEGLRRNEI